MKYNEVKSEVEVGARRAPQTLLDNFSSHNIFFHSLLKYHIERNTFTYSYLLLVCFSVADIVFMLRLDLIFITFLCPSLSLSLCMDVPIIHLVKNIEKNE